jgi:inner membrane protein
MDPFTQGALGAALVQATRSNTPHLRTAGVFGFLAGMAADLDVIIRSSTDPLLFLEYHRQFTHSLVFIPVGGLLCALVFYGLWGRRHAVSFKHIFLFCTLGYATHGLLDACTSYGTMLWWPFSEARIAGSIVPVIDPLFTIPFAILTFLSWQRRKAHYAIAALAWGGMYLGIGAWQHQRAIAMGQELAAARGHTPLRIDAKPSFANILVWKVIYETTDNFYVDAVRAGFAPQVFEGRTLSKLDTTRDLPWLDPASQQAADIERFRIFSLGFVAEDPQHPDRIIDVRYSFVPNEISPLWSIELSPTAAATDHVAYRTHRDDPQASFARLWALITAPSVDQRDSNR